MAPPIFHHITTYKGILEATQFRAGASMVCSIGCLALMCVTFVHSLKRDQAFRGAMGTSSLALAYIAWHFISVSVSLFIDPIPTAARGGISVGLIFAGIGCIYLGAASVAYMPRVAKMLRAEKERMDTVTAMQRHPRIWPQFARKHGTV